jgi:predicted transcriptional regulator YdeE
MEYEIVQLDEKWVNGSVIRAENRDGKAIGDISALWTDFFETEKHEMIQAVAPVALGVYTDYETDENAPFSYLAGYEVKRGSQNALFPVKRIVAGKYARYTMAGNAQRALGEIWQAVWSADYKRMYISDFEEYTGMGTPEATVSVYIGIG